MKQRTNQIFVVCLMILLVNSIVYYEINDNIEDQSLRQINNPLKDDSSTIEIDEVEIDDYLIKKSETLGDYQLQGFFPGGTGYIYGEPRLGETLIEDPADEDPYNRANVVEWVPYDDIKDDATLAKEFYWRALSTVPLTWPNNTDWFYLREQGYPNEPSKIYSPVFDEGHEISGKVHWCAYLEVNNSQVFSEPITIGYRLNLYLFDPDDPNNPSLIGTTTRTYPISMSSGLKYFSDDIPTTTIPSGHRLRWDILVRFSTVPTTGSFLQYNGYPWNGGGSFNWNINDGIYSNSYTINNGTRMAGIQLNMRSKAFPNITVSGVTNNTVYQSAQNVDIDVTSGSISSYRWDGGSWISFSDHAEIPIPETHGWHDLEIKASDPIYNNTKVDYYKIGYDASITNVVLEDPLNGSLIIGGSGLDFTVFSVDSVTYEWDLNGTEIPLSSPFDLYAPTNYEGTHNLTVKTTDFYTNESYFFIFTFDSDSPLIVLYNVDNGSTYAPGKVIEVEITDTTGIQSVLYHWDSGGDVPWSPAQGNIYQALLPTGNFYHYLYVTAIDNYAHQTDVMYRFLTDDAVFLVELAELRNDSYYLGGETVIVSAFETNGTILYQWDSGSIKDGTLIASQLTLNGTDALPNTPGVHNLTIISANKTDDLFVFYFFFTVDHEAPVIDNDIIIYNNTRFTKYIDFVFNITDNYTSLSDLIVLISEDGKTNRSLFTPFELSLILYNDGPHEFYLYVYDLAGNFDVKYITFIVDSTEPVIEISIPDMINLGGTDYVPADVIIYVTITDTDPTVITEYRWNSGSYTPFTDSFILSEADGWGVLRIRATDTLSNSETIWDFLTIDSIAPNISIVGSVTQPLNNSKINFNSVFEFDTDDSNPDTIKEVMYNWDIFPGYWNVSDSYDFTTKILPWYPHNSVATLVLIVEDYLGNNASFTYKFLVDIEAPEIDLYYFDEMWIQAIIDESYWMTGNTPIWYNNNSNTDLYSIYYEFSGHERNLLTSANNWTFYVPWEDGDYTLTIDLYDDVISETKNHASATYTIRINDIEIEFIDPISSEWTDGTTYFLNMLYDESFSFTVNIVDSVNKTEIIGLENRVENNEFFLNTSISNLNATAYLCFIGATNLTSGTTLDFVFYISGGGEQRLFVDLVIDKRRGELSIIEEQSNLTVQYDTNITIALNLKDHLGENQTIDHIEVNGELIPAFYQIVNTSTFWFNYSTHDIIKGNHTLDIFAESIFHYDSTDENLTLEFEILPLNVLLDIQISNYTVLENTDLVITAFLCYENGTGIGFTDIQIFIYIFNVTDSDNVNALIPANFTSVQIHNVTTNPNGYYTMIFRMSEGIDYVMVAVTYEGGIFTDTVFQELEERILTLTTPGFPTRLLYIIIFGSVAFIAIVSFVVYRMTRGKPIDEIMETITDDDIIRHELKLCPGAMITIFDQRKGPIPLVTDHKLDTEKFIGRMRIGVENFLLKIADQAYSSLGFEEHDAGRRVGSIILPAENMIGFVHGIQLPNRLARGGFENLSLIVLAESEYGNFLLNYQDHMFEEVDELIEALKDKKPLEEVEQLLSIVRKKAILIMLAVLKVEKIDL